MQLNYQLIAESRKSPIFRTYLVCLKIAHMLKKSIEKKILWTKWKFIKIYMKAHRMQRKPVLGVKILNSIT